MCPRRCRAAMLGPGTSAQGCDGSWLCSHRPLHHRGVQHGAEGQSGAIRVALPPWKASPAGPFVLLSAARGSWPASSRGDGIPLSASLRFY